jgi:hypothetical protein
VSFTNQIASGLSIALARRRGDASTLDAPGDRCHHGAMNRTTPSEALADLEALCANLGKTQDPELVERVYREKGWLDVAVDLIRETRDE